MRSPEEYGWSSARAHLHGQDDGLVSVAPLLQMMPDWPALLNSGLDESEGVTLRRHERTGRPLGDESFVKRLEQIVGRILRRQKPGPKPMN